MLPLRARRPRGPRDRHEYQRATPLAAARLPNGPRRGRGAREHEALKRLGGSISATFGITQDGLQIILGREWRRTNSSSPRHGFSQRHARPPPQPERVCPSDGTSAERHQLDALWWPPAHVVPLYGAPRARLQHRGRPLPPLHEGPSRVQCADAGQGAQHSPGFLLWNLRVSGPLQPVARGPLCLPRRVPLLPASHRALRLPLLLLLPQQDLGRRRHDAPHCQQEARHLAAPDPSHVHALRRRRHLLRWRRSRHPVRAAPPILARRPHRTDSPCVPPRPCPGIPPPAVPLSRTSSCTFSCTPTLRSPASCAASAFS